MDLNPMRGSAWLQAQRSVIGALLIDPDHCAGEIFQCARIEHFGDASLRHVFEAARGLYAENRALDAVTILDAAGTQYEQLLRDCMTATPTCANLGEYLEILQSAARLETLRRAAYDILDAGSAKEAARIIEQANVCLMDRDPGEDLSLEECIGDYLDRMNDQTPPDYLTWGIPELDKFLTVSPGQFVILAADSSVGKTALALQFAYHVASTGKKVGFFSLETGKESLTNRLMAERQVAGIEMHRSQWKQLTRYDFRSASDAGERSRKIPLRILRNFETVEAVRTRTVQRGFDVIFIDYVQLLQAEGENRAQIVTNISMGLHRMAQQLGVTVIGLSQITPPDKSSSRRITKDDLRESRQLKQDADAILIMTPAEDGNKNLRELTVDKNKDGASGRLLLNFDPKHMTFTYATPPGKAPASKPPMFEDMDDKEGGPLPF